MEVCGVIKKDEVVKRKKGRPRKNKPIEEVPKGEKK